MPTSPRFCTTILVAVLAAASFAACGDDDDEPEATPSEPSSGAGSAVEVTLTESAAENLPDEVAAGVVEVVVSDETEAAGGELNFTRVEDGTTEAEFLDAIETVFGGGEIPDLFLDNAGVIDRSTVTLDPGEYLVWYDLAAELERESTRDDLVLTSVTVTGDGGDAELPEADGTVTASDYAFDLDVAAGPSTVSFVNSSDRQLHHAVIVDFGTNDPALIEENMGAILEAEDPSALPEGIDGEQIDFEFGGSGVFGPGSAGTFEVEFADGNTYAVLCFLQDREGGPPHADAYDMYEVFTL